MSTQIETREFVRQRAGHAIRIDKEKRLGNPYIEHRIKRAMTYLRERWMRVHHNSVVGDVMISLTDSDLFIKDQIAVVGTWWVFNDVPDEFRTDLEAHARHIPPPGQLPAVYRFLLPMRP